MSWWRKKQEQDEDKENILDLDTIVWRGIDPQERLERLAASAQAEDDHHHGKLPELTRNHYIPPSPLPSVPLPVEEVTRFVENNDAPSDETDTNADHLSRELTAEEEMIEAEIRDQILAEIDTQLEAQMENTDPKPMHAPKPVTAPQQMAPQQVTPDVSDAIKTIVADEIGGWLNHNVQRIIAESVTASLKENADAIPTSSTKSGPAHKAAIKAKKAVAKKALAKKSATKAVKKAPVKAKTKAPAKTIKNQTAKASAKKSSASKAKKTS